MADTPERRRAFLIVCSSIAEPIAVARATLSDSEAETILAALRADARAGRLRPIESMRMSDLAREVRAGQIEVVWEGELDEPTRLRYLADVESVADEAGPNWLGEHWLGPLRKRLSQYVRDLSAASKSRGESDSPGDGPGSISHGGTAAIDENDVALLAFLDQRRSVRRKVADVLPDTGPQDRKAIANRLRKLADRTPPLVDYPKGGRKGVAILPAGTRALEQARASKPR